MKTILFPHVTGFVILLFSVISYWRQHHGNILEQRLMPRFSILEKLFSVQEISGREGKAALSFRPTLEQTEISLGLTEVVYANSKLLLATKTKSVLQNHPGH